MVVMQATMCTRRAAFDNELSEQADDEDENVSPSTSNRVLAPGMEVFGIARGGTTYTNPLIPLTAEFELVDIHSNPTVEATEPNTSGGFFVGDPKATKPEDGDQTESSSPVGAAIRAAIRADSVPTMGNHNGHPKHNWRDGRKGMIPSG